MITIVLPWPDKILSPSARVKHWAPKAAAVKLAKEMAFCRVLNRHDDLGDVDLEIEYIFHPPDRRKRDLDNMVAACKAYLDGACQGLRIDDSQIKLVKPIRWGALVKGGSVELRIGAITITADSGNTAGRYYRKDE